MKHNHLIYLCLVGRGNAGVRDIARRLNRAYSTAYYTLSNLRERGLITWERKRNNTLTLTPAGVEAVRGYALIPDGERLRLGKGRRV